MASSDRLANLTQPVSVVVLKFKVLVMAFLLLCVTNNTYANDGRKAVWYRYYDHKGVASISSSVTPNHIRFGYEALDQNLQVIYKNRAYNAEADNRAASERQKQSLEKQYDQRLKRAYGNSKTATLKREQQLASIRRQLDFQQQQLRSLMNDKVNLKRRQLGFMRKGEDVPQSLITQINQVELELSNVRKVIEKLQLNLRETTTQYNTIISRLQTMEAQSQAYGLR